MSFNAMLGQQDEEKMKELEAAKKSEMLGQGMKGAGAASGSESALGGAAQGALVAGPVGAVAGAALGLAKGMAAQAKQKRELKAQAIAKQGDIAQDTGRSQNQALANILEGLRSAFIR